MNISPSMKVFGTVINPFFGDVEETGIMITISDIYEHKFERHITSFFKNIKEKYELRKHIKQESKYRKKDQ